MSVWSLAVVSSHMLRQSSLLLPRCWQLASGIIVAGRTLALPSRRCGGGGDLRNSWIGPTVSVMACNHHSSGGSNPKSAMKKVKYLG